MDPLQKVAAGKRKRRAAAGKRKRRAAAGKRKRRAAAGKRKRRAAAPRQLMHYITEVIPVEKPRTRDYIGKTIKKGQILKIYFTINTGNYHEDLGVFSQLVIDIDSKLLRQIKTTYEITKGTLGVELALIVLIPLAVALAANEISRIINRIRDRHEIENLRISVDAKEVLAKNALETNGFGGYVLSEPDRIRDFHSWRVTLPDGTSGNIIVFDNGETQLLLGNN